MFVALIPPHFERSLIYILIGDIFFRAYNNNGLKITVMRIHSLIKLASLVFFVGLTACNTDGINSPVLPDMNPSANIVEVELRAKVSQVEYKDGVASTVWSYNGIVPGPTIDAKVGDTLIVHFYNELPESTTVHWHGLELPANMDGSMIAQKPVQPGGYFRYEFKLLRASTFWYHPHMRGNEQVELGLQGMLVVHDPVEDERLKLPKIEHLWVLDDVLLDETGSMVKVGFPDEPAARAEMQVNGREGNTLLVNGLVKPSLEWTIGEPQRIRVVNTANTRFMRLSIPGHTLYRIGGDAGLLEAPIALAEILQVEIPSAGHMMDGMDGMDMVCMDMGDGMHDGDMPMANTDMTMAGMDMPMPKTMSNPDINKGLMLTPGERADFIVIPQGNAGDTLAIEWHDMKRGRHTACIVDGMVKLEDKMGDGEMAPMTMVEVKLVKAVINKGPAYQLPTSLRSVTPIDVAGAVVMPVMFGHTEPDMNGNLDFFVAMMNGEGITFENMMPSMAPMARVGDTRIIEVTNMTMGDHNFHIHGFMFQLIETEYVDMDHPMNNYIVPAAQLENKDTIHLPRRTGMMKDRSKTITRLAIHFGDEGREGQITAAGKMPTDSTSGGWLFHCHLLDHGDRGMASFLQIVD
ncbi:MAG: FtsP/CotA-like multicopper oxidase with cupredoxin domain [Oleispira sp.]|jgi:FtsP/CotA-like multicopper oxidase with cupredoxin domain